MLAEQQTKLAEFVMVSVSKVRHCVEDAEVCACLFQNPCDLMSSFPQIQKAMEGLWIWFSLTRTVPPCYSGLVTTCSMLAELPWAHFISSVFLTFLGRRGYCFCTPYLLSFICTWGMQGSACVWPEINLRCCSSGASHLIFKDRVLPWPGAH